MWFWHYNWRWIKVKVWENKRPKGESFTRKWKEGISSKNVRFVPQLTCNLFSLTTAMTLNVEIVSKGQQNILRKGKYTINFKPICKNENAFMLAITAERHVDEKAFKIHTRVSSSTWSYSIKRDYNFFLENPELIEATARVPKINETTVDTHKYHLQLGHVCENTTHLTAKYYGIKITSKFLPCADCALAKRSQHRLSRAATYPATKWGERMFLDMTKIYNISLGGENTLQHSWMNFWVKKSDFLKEEKSVNSIYN